MIYTFYSYKGGVGRSMALANVAELFYQAGFNVLIVDWDLEAPGLERFFPDRHLEEVLDHPGLMDMLMDYKRRMAQPLDGHNTEEVDLPLAGIEKYLLNIYTPDKSSGNLSLIPAGKRLGENFGRYAQSVRTFDWQDFYQNWEGELFFEWLRNQFLGLADVVLIDSRTGVSEMGGVCTYQLADVVLMLCAPNQQNLDGTYEMARDFKRPEVHQLRHGRPLEILVIPARVEDRAEIQLLNEFRVQFLDKIGMFLPKTLEGESDLFWQLRIPYVPFYAFKEIVAIREKGETRSEDMVKAFNSLVTVMARLAPIDASIRHILPPTSTSIGTTMDVEERIHLETLIAAHRMRLRTLEVQMAQLGSQTPPHIQIEIEDIRAGISRLTGQLITADIARSVVRTPRVLVSTSLRNNPFIESLSQQLRVRGLRVWDNRDPGRSTEVTIRDAVNSVDGAVLYLTPESLKSNFFVSVELPAILARYKREPSFPIIPILDSVTFNQVDHAIRPSGIVLSDFSSTVLSSNVDDIVHSAEIISISRQTLKTVLLPCLRRVGSDQTIGINLFTYPEIGLDETAIAYLDWVPLFKPSLPLEHTWRTILLPALKDLQDVLRQEGIRPIALRLKAKLSAGYAFGYIFRLTTGFTLWIEQFAPNRDQTEWWRTDEPAAEGSALMVRTEIVDPKGEDITVEVSVSQDVSGAVEEWMARATPSIRKRIHFTASPESSPYAVKDGSHALAIAQQIRSAIMKERTSKSSGTIHLFGALPVALAVLIGTQLNACGPIQCYEYQRPDYIYEPSCRLE